MTTKTPFCSRVLRKRHVQSLLDLLADGRQVHVREAVVLHTVKDQLHQPNHAACAIGTKIARIVSLLIQKEAMFRITSRGNQAPTERAAPVERRDMSRAALAFAWPWARTPG